MLEIKNINIGFDHKLVLKNTDFKAYQSQITIIQSKSGYGKTSLLNLMNDASSDFEFYKVGNQSIDKGNVRKYVSMSPQTSLFVSSLTMKDNILLSVLFIIIPYMFSCIYIFNLKPVKVYRK